MPTRSVVDQLALLFSAGHETTAKSLAWALYDVLARPDVLARVRAELDEIFGDGPLDAAGCGELRYLSAVLKESMRLSPVTTVLQRDLRAPLRLREHELPAGTIVAPSNLIAHRHPSVWSDPETFRPERFLGGFTPGPSEYFPFGGGTRRCIGAAFAQLEMPILLAAILRRADLRLVRPTRPKPRYEGITVGPADGLPLDVTAVRR